MDYFLLLAGFVCLIGAGEILVRGATALSLRFKIQPFIIGMTVVAFGTSAPELLVSVLSALEGHPDIATGNIVGSNISNIALVLGVTAFVYPIVVRKSSIQIDWPVLFGASLLLWFFMWDGLIVFYEGAIMFSSLVIFLLYIIRKGVKEKQEADDVDESLEKQFIWMSLLLTILGCVGLMYGADLLISSAVIIAGDFGISERIISLTVIAIGTSLPELVTSLIAAFKQKTDIALGSILGSNIFNILSIMGITSMIEEVSVNEMLIFKDMIWMVGLTLLLFLFMVTRRQLNKLEGSVLASIYIVYMYLMV